MFKLKYFVLYGSSLETNSLLTSISSNLAIFCFCKSHFFYFFVTKNYVPSTHSYTQWKKKTVKLFQVRYMWSDQIHYYRSKGIVFKFLKSDGSIKGLEKRSKCTKNHKISFEVKDMFIVVILFWFKKRG